MKKLLLVLALASCASPTSSMSSADATTVNTDAVKDSGGTRTVLAVGDSITLGAPGSIGGYRAALNARRPDLVFVGSLDNVGRHEGHNGKRIDQIRLLVLPVIDDFHPDIVLLLAGTNDLTLSSDVPQILAEYAAFAEELREHAAVVLVANLPFRAGEHRDDTILFNAGLIDAFATASPGISVHDVCGALVFPDDFADGAHPNDGGYGKMTDGWDIALSKERPLNRTTRLGEL